MPDEELTDLDEALDGLAVEEPPTPAAGPPKLPPQLPKKGKLTSTRRVPFDDLFVVDSTPSAAARGSPEAKIDYLREKLKQAEEVISRVREAWGVREKEMDALEEAADTAGHRADEAAQGRQALEGFIEGKKAELEEYVKNVHATVAEKDAELAQLRDQLRMASEHIEGEEASRSEELEELRAELAAGQQELVDTREAMEHQLEVRDEALGKIKGMFEEQRELVFERDQKIDELSRELEEAEQRVARAQAGSRESAGQLEAQLAQVQAEAEIEKRSIEAELEQLRAALQEEKGELEAQVAQAGAETEIEKQAWERDLSVRDEAIRKLKATVQDQKTALASRDAEVDNLQQLVESPKSDPEVDKLRNKVRLLQAEIKAKSAELANREAAPVSSDAADLERLKKALAVAQRLLADLKAGDPKLFDSTQSTGEVLARLRKAVLLASKAADLI